MDHSLIRPAKQEGGKVYIEQDGAWIVCPDAKTQTMGEADSTGIVIIGAMGAVYFSSIQLDIRYLLRTLSDALGKIAEITRAQYVINADNAQFGQMAELVSVGEGILDIRTTIDEYKLI
jgi:hypothetical protein